MILVWQTETRQAVTLRIIGTVTNWGDDMSINIRILSDYI